MGFFIYSIMKYIKTFESHSSKDKFASEIKRIWGIDPYILNDIILSSTSESNIWGEVVIKFLLITTDKDNKDVRNMDEEYTDKIFNMTNGEIEVGEHFDSLERVIKGNDYTPAIESFITSIKELEDSEDLINIIEDQLLYSKSTYQLTWDENLPSSIYLYFNKKESE